MGARSWKVRATPAARRAAKEAGVDLAEIARVLALSGPVGEKDVQAFVEQRRPPPDPAG